MAGDPSLTDVELQNEIDLVGALVLAASQNEGPMSQDRIDEVLGVDDVEPAGPSESDDAGDPGAGEPRGGVGTTP